MLKAASANWRRPEIAIPLAVTIIALLYRFIGLGWGLPTSDRIFSLHPDEPINLLYAGQVHPERLVFTPGFYNYGTLYLTLTSIAASIGRTLTSTEGGALLFARLLSVLAGSLLAGATASALLRWGAEEGEQPHPGAKLGAWTAGLLVALTAGLSVHSRFATVDVMAVALLMAGLYTAARAGSAACPARTLIFAGVLVGLAAACKYNMALGVLGVFAAVGAVSADRRLLTGAAAFAAMVGAFLVGCPGIVLEPKAFRRDFIYEFLHSGTGHEFVFAGSAPGFVYHVGNLVLAAGPLILLLGLLGLAWGARARMRLVWVLIAFAVPYYLLIGRAEVKFLRYVLPLVPPLACGVGITVAKLAEQEGRRRAATALAIVVVGGIDLGGLARSVPFTLEMAGPDPRDRVGAQIRKENPEALVGIARDPWFWSATLYPEVDAPRSVGARQFLSWMLEASGPRVTRYLPEGTTTGRQDFDIRLLEITKPDFFVETSLEISGAERLARLASPPTEEMRVYAENYRLFHARLSRDYQLDSRSIFQAGREPLVEDMEYVRPSVLVWKRKTP